MNAYELKTKAQTIKAGFCLYCSARPCCHVVPWKRYSPVAFVVCLILGYLKIECLYLLFTDTMMSNYSCRDIKDFVSLPQCILFAYPKCFTYMLLVSLSFPTIPCSLTDIKTLFFFFVCLIDNVCQSFNNHLSKKKNVIKSVYKKRSLKIYFIVKKKKKLVLICFFFLWW